MNALQLTQTLIRSSLNLNESESLSEDTYLLGGFPEFDSLTVATLLGEIEEAVGCEIDDDEISGETFETVGSLAAFVHMKMDLSHWRGVKRPASDSAIG